MYFLIHEYHVVFYMYSNDILIGQTSSTDYYTDHILIFTSKMNMQYNPFSSTND